MANWDFRRVELFHDAFAKGGISHVTLEDGEEMTVYVVPDGSPGGFRFQLRGKDYPIWLKEQRAKEEAAKKAAEAEAEALLGSMIDGSNGLKP